MAVTGCWQEGIAVTDNGYTNILKRKLYQDLPYVTGAWK